MNELLIVDFEKQTVLGRDLYKALEIKERFSVWADRQRAIFGDELTTVLIPTEVENNGGTQLRTLEDFAVSVDNAKHICLMSRTEKGKQCRQYLIDLEKVWNSPEQVMARALKVADQTIASLKVRTQMLEEQVVEMNNTISELKPKASYLDRILESKETVCVTQIAQDYGMSAKKFNKMLNSLGVQHKVNDQWILYSKHQGKGYVHSNTYTFERADGRTDAKMNTEWTQKGRLFLYELLKREGVLPMIEQ